jgi:hypothetical protein
MAETRKSAVNTLIAVGALILTLGAGIALYFAFPYLFSRNGPRLIFSKPIELDGPITCDAKGGMVTFKKIRVWLKNTGTEPAADVAPVWQTFKIEPAGDSSMATNNPLSIAPANCKRNAQKAETSSSIAPDQEISRESANGAFFTAPISGKDEPVQIFTAACAYYSGVEDSGHGTCATYRLTQPGGKTSFACGTPITGTFEVYGEGQCAE